MRPGRRATSTLNTMSDHNSPHSNEQSEDQEFQPSGNRPAQNANLSTPGAVNQDWKNSEGATDFLGLDAELGGSQQNFRRSAS